MESAAWSNLHPWHELRLTNPKRAISEPISCRAESADADAAVHYPLSGHRDSRWALSDGFALFILAGISDALDGLLARWLSQRTTLGQYLDPIADKLLLSTLFVVLTHVGLMPRYVTVLVFSRDLGILLISTLLFATGALRDFRPSLFGKLNTLVQIIALIAVLCREDICFPCSLATLRDGLIRAIAVLAPFRRRSMRGLCFGG